jgi:hypothetical protein
METKPDRVHASGWVNGHGVSPDEAIAKSALAKIESAFTKTDLTDPDKVNQMIGHAVDELLAQDFKNLSACEREEIAAWMRNDPLLREKLLKAFEGTLS